MIEIIFVVEEAPEGSLTAKTLGESILTGQSQWTNQKSM